MSRTTQIVLALLVSLAVIVGIYTSVEGAGQAKIGSHPVASPHQLSDNHRAAGPELIPLQVNEQKSGHDCDSESRYSPDD